MSDEFEEDIDSDIGLLIDEWKEVKKIHRFSESGAGVRNFEKFLADMGYGNTTGGLYDNQPIIAFLVDNPGAVESLFEFIREHNVLEWRESLISHLPYKE